MRKTLVVTNDFPPREGGIQTFVHELALRQPRGSMVILAPHAYGAADFDRTAPAEVIRYPARTLLPTPGVRRAAVELVRSRRCDVVWFAAMWPLAMLAKDVRRAGASRVIASTHGHEAGWALLPGPRGAMRRLSRHVDAMTYLGDFTRTRLAKVVIASTPLVHLPPGVDTRMFHPGVDGRPVRERLGLARRPVIVCVSRLVPRKGQDVLIRALSSIRRQVPGAALLLVGGGNDTPRLQRLAVTEGVADDVVFVGAVPPADLPSYYAAGDVFAMPCRTRIAGLEAEGLGIVYLEASATGLPVIVGDSGGAPDAVLDGRTGHVVRGRSVRQVADRIVPLLADPARAQAMGAAGRQWVVEQWQWDGLARRLAELFAGTAER